jgi:hypothetical protein
MSMRHGGGTGIGINPGIDTTICSSNSIRIPHFNEVPAIPAPLSYLDAARRVSRSMNQ